MQCSNNLKRLGMAVHAYTDQHERPPSGTVVNTALEPEERLSWVVDVLPFHEQEKVYKGINREEGWKRQQKAFPRLQVLVCPSEVNHSGTAIALTTYVGVAGIGKGAARLPLDNRRAGFFGYDRLLMKLEEIPDGMSNTLMLMETSADLGSWAAGGPATVRGIDPGARPHLGAGRTFGRIHEGSGGRLISGKPSGIVVMVDGGTRFLRESVDADVFEAAATVAGGEAVKWD